MKRKSGKILIIDDDKDVLFAAKMLLKPHFETVQTDFQTQRIPELLSQNSYDVVLLDMNFSIGATSGKEGLDWLKKIKNIEPQTQVLVMTAYGDISLAVNAMKEGATDFIVKPWEEEKLLATVKTLCELNQSKKEANQYKQHHQLMMKEGEQSYQQMIFNSPSMKSVMNTVEKVAKTDANVLILGENGTGKDLVAQAIHRQSSRSNKPYVKVDLGAVSETLFESELFGHSRGAFTDAKEERPGRFEIANGGTLFLDEIGNLSFPLQAKLLTALQNRQITRVGSNKPIPIDIRLICATNMPLLEMIRQQTFRQDLLYRINTVEIKLPPLRDRIEDIPLLADYYLKFYSNKYRKNISSISEKALLMLEKYPWPGNIRELQHSIERAIIMTDNEILQVDDFLLENKNFSNSTIQKEEVEKEDFNLEDIEKQTISKALEKNNGNISETAKELGLGRTTLYRKMQKYKL
jgi:DNA-binding NtrC family response regulator